MSIVSFPNLDTDFVVALDLETQGLSARRDTSKAVFLCTLFVYRNGKKVELTCYHESILKSTLASYIDEGAWFLVHNAMFDIVLLRNRGIMIPWNRVLDTQVMAYLHYTNRQSYSLDNLTGQKLDFLQLLKDNGQVEQDVKNLREWWEIDHRKDAEVLRLMLKYNLADVKALVRLYKGITKDFPQKLTEVYFSLEQPMLAVLENLENSGIQLDGDLAVEVLTKDELRIKEINEEIAKRYPLLPELKWTGTTYEPTVKTYTKGIYTSSAHVPAHYTDSTGVFVAAWEGHIPNKTSGKHIYNHCPLLPYNSNPATGHTWWLLSKESPEVLNSVELTATGKPKVDKGFIASLELPEHLPLSELGKRNKRVQMISTWLSAQDKDGRIRATFANTRTRTGRLATEKPNMQNIPASDGNPESDASLCRKMFTAKPGHLILCADLDQIELRVLAYYLWKVCKDKSLIEEFDKPDADPHTSNATRWKLPRKIAKMAVFLLIYGGGAGLLAKRAGITLAEAKAALETIHTEQPAIRLLMDKVVSRCKKQGYVITLGGRYIHYPELNSSNQDMVARASRQCFNALIQGSARDVLHMLAIESLPVVQKYNGNLVNVVHDECLAEFLCIDAENARVELNQVWQNRYDLVPGVRVNGDWNLGENWLEAK